MRIRLEADVQEATPPEVQGRNPPEGKTPCGDEHELPNPFNKIPVVHRYTRAEAIDDGILIDVSKTAREAGIRFPTAITRGVQDDCVEWTDADRKKSRSLASGQDESGRLWDVVWMAKVNLTLRKGQPIANPLMYSIRRLPRPGRGRRQRVQLKLIIDGGDNGKPAITILLPNEN